MRDLSSLPLDVLVLGPVRVRLGGEVIELARPLERALAARLALASGEAVGDDRLARDLWGDTELNRPTQRLRVLASRLRANLGPARDRLRRLPGGYALAAVPSDLRDAQLAAGRLAAAVKAGDQVAVRDDRGRQPRWRPGEDRPWPTCARCRTRKGKPSG